MLLASTKHNVVHCWNQELFIVFQLPSQRERTCTLVIVMIKGSNCDEGSAVILQLDSLTVEQLDSKLKERERLTEVYAEIFQTVPRDHLDFEKVYWYTDVYRCVQAIDRSDWNALLPAIQETNGLKYWYSWVVSVMAPNCNPFASGITEKCAFELDLLIACVCAVRTHMIASVPTPSP